MLCSAGHRGGSDARTCTLSLVETTRTVGCSGSESASSNQRIDVVSRKSSEEMRGMRQVSKVQNIAHTRDYVYHVR